MNDAEMREVGRMIEKEVLLIMTITALEDKNERAFLLEKYIARYGGLSNEAGRHIKELMRKGEMG